MSKYSKSLEEHILENKLKTLGLFEKGMSFEDMKKIDEIVVATSNEVKVVTEDESHLTSSNLNENDFKNTEIANDIMSSPENSIYIHDDSGYCSNLRKRRSIFSDDSPEHSPRRIKVVAEVHHECGYSPDKDKTNNASISKI